MSLLLLFQGAGAPAVVLPFLTTSTTGGQTNVTTGGGQPSVTTSGGQQTLTTRGPS